LSNPVVEESPLEWIELATAFSEIFRPPKVIGATGGSLGPVVRRNAASCKVELSGSDPAGERGTNRVEGTGGAFVDFGFFMRGVEGMLRMACGGDRLI
jgi:hypothetical protein